MNDRVYEDDPTATYRGYRRQALYCLYRLFEDTLPDDFILQPEGDEDLRIFDAGGNVIEVVQVKDLTENLTASKFKPPFYERISAHCQPDSRVAVNIVSFGPVGPQLAQALDNTKATPTQVLTTLTKDREAVDRHGKKTNIKGLSVEAATNFLSHANLTQVKESELTDSVIARLRETLTAGDPERAFENLMWWLITSAEKQQKLTRPEVISKLHSIGRYIAHLAAHSQEWNRSIIPITANDTVDRSKLEREFFLGGRVRVDHVAAGFDVRRETLLASIHDLFKKENVVVVRAASGQGKTTLAYRYILDLAARDFRFEVLPASDLSHARQMATAVSGHVEAVDVPTLVYVDVRPGDTFWKEFVLALSATPQIRILVTIREEDWFRSGVSLDDFRFIEMALEFDETEGRQIYASLQARQTSAFLDFDDAWARLGERKSLFEFVYLITQAESLSNKIQTQVQRLQDQTNSGDLLEGELQLLRIVSVASAFESRVKLQPLVLACNIPEPKRTLDLFANEYLVRPSDDGAYVEGFHSVRSELLVSFLTDPVLKPWRDSAQHAVPLLDENDLESFLLCSFSRKPHQRAEILESLTNITPKTWPGLRGVCVALLWLGIDEYVRANADLLDETRKAGGQGWWCLLDWDLAQTPGKSGLSLFEWCRNIGPEFTNAANAAKQFTSRQTDKIAVFKYFIEWFSNHRPLPALPKDDRDIVAFSEVAFWLGHVKDEADVLAGIDFDFLTHALDILPIHLFADLAAAASHASNTKYESWVEHNRQTLIERVRKQTGIVSVVEGEEDFVGHYIIDLDPKASRIRQRSSAERDDDVSINDLSVERVEILSRCFPGCKRYGVNAYGHRMTFFDSMPDESEKRMPVENISNPWLPAFNSLALGDVELRFRPHSWDEYFGNVRSIRQRVLDALADLIIAIRSLRSDGKVTLPNTEAWDACVRMLNGGFLLPSSAVDEWGFVAERRSLARNKLTGKRFSAVTKLDPYNKCVSEYSRTVGNFMRQALESLILSPHIRNSPNASARRAVLKKAKELNLNEGSIRLSVTNGIDALIAVNKLHECELSLLSENDEWRSSKEFLERESQSFLEALTVWCKFVFPEEFPTKTGKFNSRTKNRNGLKSCLEPTTNRIKEGLRRLKSEGITAKLVPQESDWNNEAALVIQFDADHPVRSLLVCERLWNILSEALKPDRNKIVRTKAMDLYWPRIVAIPTVAGKSLERNAYADMKTAAYQHAETLTTEVWRFIPKQVSEETWEKLGIARWERQPSWDIFDKFAASYNSLFQHVDHLADLNRCDADIDELGQTILQDYLSREQERANPFLQETIDDAAAVLSHLPKRDEETFVARPNLFACAQFLTPMSDAFRPRDDHENRAKLTIKEISEWRDRLKFGFALMGFARYLWIADSLGFDGFDFDSFPVVSADPL